MTTFWLIAAVILIPAAWRAAGQTRRDRRGARAAAEREAYFRSLGFTPLPGTGLSPETIKKIRRHGLLT